jgi:dihydrodipicolinate synthase/N-acetylneuraminate lyase
LYDLKTANPILRQGKKEASLMSLTEEQYKGIFTIPVTPFKESGDVDVASLHRCIEFSVECGAHGLVGPVNASQFAALTDAERDLFVRTMVEVVDHAVPTMAGNWPSRRRRQVATL